MKRAASLSSNLLAKKGTAVPILGHRSPSHMHPDEHAYEDETPIRVAPPPVMPTPPIQRPVLVPSPERTDVAKRASVAPQPVVLPTKVAPPVRKPTGKSPVGAGQRIAMTVRLDHESHLKLKIHAAHSRLSAQDIFYQALEAWLPPEGGENSDG